MIDRDMFYLLREIKSGDGMSWAKTYLAIELLIIAMVMLDAIFVFLDFCLHYFCSNNRINYNRKSYDQGEQ